MKNIITKNMIKRFNQTIDINHNINDNKNNTKQKNDFIGNKEIEKLLNIKRNRPMWAHK